MQVIASMLALRAEQTNNAHAIMVAKEVEAKIQTMALVHHKLYQSRNLSRINMQEYLTELIALLISRNRLLAGKVSYEFHVEPIDVLLDTAIPCGLVINELVSNALKHAFPGGMSGTIRLQLERRGSGELALLFADNGVGLPDGVDIHACSGLGIQTIFNLVEHQLKGSVHYDTRHGVACHIRFHDDLYTARV
jgi:two-component sensor histidine kinase